MQSEVTDKADDRDVAQPAKRHRRVTRERLLDAAVEVFAERGVRGARVEEVTDRAGFTRGAFYSNFSGMDELVVEMIEREGSATLAQVSAAVDASLQDPQPLSSVSARLCQAWPFGVKNHLLRGELALLAVRDPELAAPYLAVHRQLSERYTRLLRDSITATGRRLTVSAQDAMEMLEALFDASVRSSVMRGTGDPQGLVRRMLPMMLEAITEPVSGSR